MTKKDLLLLDSITFESLAYIALCESKNMNQAEEKRRNVYYDVATHKATIDTDEAKDGLKIRPLKMRLLNNGHRVHKDVSVILAGIIQNAMTEQESKGAEL